MGCLDACMIIDIAVFEEKIELLISLFYSIATNTFLCYNELIVNLKYV